MENMVHEATDPLHIAVKLSILGNSMDLMVADTSLTIEKSIADKTKLPLSDENYSKFRQQLQTTQHLLIFGRQRRRNCVRQVADRNPKKNT